MKSQVPVRPCLVITRFWPQFRSRFCHVGKGINIGTDLIKNRTMIALTSATNLFMQGFVKLDVLGSTQVAKNKHPNSPKIHYLCQYYVTTISITIEMSFSSISVTRQINSHKTNKLKIVASDQAKFYKIFYQQFFLPIIFSTQKVESLI